MIFPNQVIGISNTPPNNSDNKRPAKILGKTEIEVKNIYKKRFYLLYFRKGIFNIPLNHSDNKRPAKILGKTEKKKKKNIVYILFYYIF